MMTRHPGLAEALMWSNAHEEALLAERVVSLGRRDATQRLAHVLCEIVARLELIQKHEGEVLQLPLLQEDFADILGLERHPHRAGVQPARADGRGPTTNRAGAAGGFREAEKRSPALTATMCISRNGATCCRRAES